jgi:inorganic pyrophosphatase
VLVHTPYPLVQGSVIACRPVGVLNMKDEAGSDAKLIALPKKKLTYLYDDMEDVDDLPELLKAQISHFLRAIKSWKKENGLKLKAGQLRLMPKGTLSKVSNAPGSKRNTVE